MAWAPWPSDNESADSPRPAHAQFPREADLPARLLEVIQPALDEDNDEHVPQQAEQMAEHSRWQKMAAHMQAGKLYSLEALGAQVGCDPRWAAVHRREKPSVQGKMKASVTSHITPTFVSLLCGAKRHGGPVILAV